VAKPTDYNALTVHHLIEIAQKLGISRCSRLRKTELIQAITKKKGTLKPQISKKVTTPLPKAKNAVQTTDAKVAPSPKTHKSVANKTVLTKSSSSGKKVENAVAWKAAEQKNKGQKRHPNAPSAKHETGKNVSPEKLNLHPDKNLPRKKPASPKDFSPKTGVQRVPQKPATGSKELPKTGKMVSSKNDGKSGLFPGTVLTEEQEKRVIQLRERLIKYRELSGVYDGEHKDRLVLMVRDPFWLHAFWELSVKLVERAKAAMGVYWHTAIPILRVFRLISDGITHQQKQHIRDIKLHGNVNNWYIDVQNPPATFLVEIGYISSRGHFFPLASSNVVETPENHADDYEGLDGNWLDVAREYDRVFKLSGGLDSNNHELKEVFEKQLKRPMSQPYFARYGTIANISKLDVELEADVVIYGKTQPDVQLTIKGEPIRLLPDGTFSVRFLLPEKRTVYPIVAVSGDGVESKTTILAIERNTKALETVYHEDDE